MEVVWTTTALEELDTIQDFIALDSPAAAHKLASALIGRASALLSRHPLGGRLGRAPGTRELPVTGTPYIVVYRVHERVEILAVIHGARRWPESFGDA